ncbi:MAG TPA: FadD3 family acyl-CoA ligase [Pseudonocardiaceae bacterium]|nr:FadD3 family acyl-CoA ligase [Pseudonocardiaceae bacterium]
MARTIPAALAEASTRFADAPALIDSPTCLTYRELHARTRIVAGALHTTGVRPGDRVAICAPNTHHWVEAALGALSAGATLVPVNTRFTGPETLDVLTRSKARTLVVAGPFLGVDRLAELRNAGDPPGLRTIVRIPTDEQSPPDPHVIEWADLDELAHDTPEPRISPDDVSDILFTSGTTGRSKGAMSAHRQALAVADSWSTHAGLGQGDRYLVVNPFFHSFGYKAGILACLLRGAAIVPQAVFDTETTMALIERERITVLPGPPTIYQSLLDHPNRDRYDLSSLRLAVTGAAMVPVTLVERMRRDLSFDTVLTGYGLTEAVVATMCRHGDDADTVAHTCGRPTAGFELRIADNTGEVLLRGPNVMLGYLDDPAATAAAIDTDGWLHTGDVGRVDERGNLRITDRLKDMYICGGFNVYPAEVEQTLAQLPGVTDSAVIGVPDERLGEVGLAYVVTNHQLSTSDIVGFCRARLANYKVPRTVEFRTALPRNASGKVLKQVLRTERNPT